MAKKRKAQRQRRSQPIQKKETNFWKITAIVAVVLLAGVTAKTLFTSSGQNTATTTSIQPTVIQPAAIQPATSLASNGLKDKVFQVAANFKCACGGCGELPLAECQCDMPRGAVEAKAFIRTKLNEGLSVQQVIELVDKEYGLKVG